MHQVSHSWLVLECVQPLQQLGSVRVIAELLESCDLRANRDHLTENLYFVCAALDDVPARPRRLEADEDDQVFGIGEALREMVQNATSRSHSAGRDDDRWVARLVNFLGFF